MHAVIFEVQPKSDRKEEYFDIAESIRGDLEKIDGFISIERFKSTVTEGKILSLSFWETESAIEEWRNQTAIKKHSPKVITRCFLVTVFELLRLSAITQWWTVMKRHNSRQPLWLALPRPSSVFLY